MLNRTMSIELMFTAFENVKRMQRVRMSKLREGIKAPIKCELGKIKHFIIVYFRSYMYTYINRISMNYLRRKHADWILSLWAHGTERLFQLKFDQIAKMSSKLIVPIDSTQRHNTTVIIIIEHAGVKNEN